MRVPVISSDDQPLMPTKPSRARGWVREGKAKGFFKDLSQYCVQLLEEPTGTDTQSIAVGVDPGKNTAVLVFKVLTIPSGKVISSYLLRQ